uniref:Uncharacterized protein n=1 Tax=Anguilla anguilla TaxID=7936 RepID=A0A0E9PMY1_ANGAN
MCFSGWLYGDVLMHWKMGALAFQSLRMAKRCCGGVCVCVSACVCMYDTFFVP